MTRPVLVSSCASGGAWLMPAGAKTYKSKTSPEVSCYGIIWADGGEGMEIHPDKVALYLRWSTDDQAAGTTLDVQMEGCGHYALSQRWHFREQSGPSRPHPAAPDARRTATRKMMDATSRPTPKRPKS